MDIEAHRDLKLLEEVAQNSRVTQRSLATKLGIALGLTNIYLRRLVRKGYIKCVNVRSNRITYLITPRGIAEKARLTYEFMDYSLHLYGDVRRHLRTVLQDCAAAGRRVAIYGRGEAAELAYLSLKEFGLEPVAIFDLDGDRTFLCASPEEPDSSARIWCSGYSLTTRSSCTTTSTGTPFNLPTSTDIRISTSSRATSWTTTPPDGPWKGARSSFTAPRLPASIPWIATR